MPLDVHTAHEDSYLAARVSGPAVLSDIFNMIAMLGETTLGSGVRRLLVDLREVQETFRFTDHFAMGERAARDLAHLERVASLVQPSRRTGASERVANKAGVTLRVFTDQAQAIAWLSE